MCVIFIGEVKRIKKLKLSEAWNTNPHGAGIALLGQKTRVIKGIMSLEKLIKTLDLLPDNRRIVCHLRQTTHGATSIENTHPFKVRDQWLFHNGILSGLGAYGENGASDTAHLARILSKLPLEDRLPLLRSLSGKYTLVDNGEIHLVGDFVKRHKVHMSNDYWDSSTRSKYFFTNTPKTLAGGYKQTTKWWTHD